MVQIKRNELTLQLLKELKLAKIGNLAKVINNSIMLTTIYNILIPLPDPQTRLAMIIISRHVRTSVLSIEQVCTNKSSSGTYA